MTVLMFEDFPVGRRFDLGPYEFTTDDIKKFAGEFDPQGFHLDEADPLAQAMGGVFASGWHTCSALMRMMCDSYLLGTASQGSAGLDEIRWLKPVLAGDTLSGIAEVTGGRRLSSRPHVGVVNFRYILENQKAEPVMRVTGMGFVNCREVA